MKHNWEYIRLGEGCVPKKQINRATKHFKTDDLIEYIDISSIDRLAHRISSTNSYIFAEAPSRAQQCVENNDVLVSLVRPNLKNVAIINDDRNNLIASSGFCILRGKALIPKFVYYIATSSFFTEKLVSKCAGAAYPAVNEEDVRNILIPQPSKDTQEKIVRELDKINEIINDCKEAIRNLDSLAQSLFYDYFGDPITNPKGWEVKALRDIIIGKLAYGAGASGIPFDGNVRYIRITDIDDNGKLKPEIAASPSVYESKYELQDGDILFARSGATVGKTYLYRSEIGKATYAGYLIKATVNQNKILPQYLFTLGKTSYYWNYIRQSINGVAQPNVNAQSYGAFIIPIPPLSLQEKFAARIEQIEQQKKGLEETIANMQTLLDSRMDYWFG